MKAIATITGEDGNTITISFDGSRLFTESFGEPTMEVGPEFATEEKAAEYIHDSWGRGWNLIWL